MRRLGWGCVFVAAALFIVMLVGAQSACPLLKCKGPDGDVWMPPFFFAPIGFPALVMSGLFVARKIWPNSRALSLAPKYFLLVFIGLAFLIPFLFGFFKGRAPASPQIQVHQ